MIVTLEQQELDKQLRFSDFLYMDVEKMEILKSEGLVKFFINQYILIDMEYIDDIEKVGFKTDYTEAGVPVPSEYIYKEKGILIRPTFVVWKKREAIFKLSTYMEKIGHVDPSDYDRVLIEQIDFVNKLEQKPGRIQRDLYYFELTASDMKILTAEDIQTLTAPRVKN